jgi:hypothetical protein
MKKPVWRADFLRLTNFAQTTNGKLCIIQISSKVTHPNRNSAALLRSRKRRAMLPDRQFSFKRISHNPNPTLGLTETHCPACGNLIAASPHLEVLDFVERLHVCPEPRAFAYPLLRNP